MASENEDSFDTELFIEEIHNLPCIWDYTSDGYSNRIEKLKSWESLCFMFYDNYTAMDRKDQNECAVKLQRRWRSLRDSYNRELKKSNTKRSGFGETKHRQYIYFNHLHFLKPLAERRASETYINDCQQNQDEPSITLRRATETYNDDSQPNEDEPSIIQISTNDSQTATKRKMSKSADQESGPIKKLPRLSDRLSQQDHPVNHTDSDLHFLLSLYDSFKAIDSHLKLEAQIHILNVIKKFNQPPATHKIHHIKKGEEGQHGVNKYHIGWGSAVSNDFT